MTKTVPTIAAFLCLTLCALAQTAAKPAAAPAKKAASAPKQTSSAGVYQGVVHLAVPESGLLSESKLMFRNLATCHDYDFIEPAGDFAFSTEEFYEARGVIVGAKFRVSSLKPLEGAAAERLQALDGKCKQAAEKAAASQTKQ